MNIKKKIWSNKVVTNIRVYYQIAICINIFNVNFSYYKIYW